MKDFLQQLHHHLKEVNPSIPFLAIESFDTSTFQFVKGEHLLDFPYLYLDFPKYFKRDEMFTFRTLFWWGHYFVLAWILQGKYLDRYKQNLLRSYDGLADRGLFILMSDNPWEWRKGSEYLLEIRSENYEEISALLKTRSFLKVHRYIEFDSPAVMEGKLIEETLASFHLMQPIVSS